MRLSISEKYLKKQKNISVTYSFLGGLAVSFVFIVFGINIDSLTKRNINYNINTFNRMDTFSWIIG